MHDRDAALLARTAAALRADGKQQQADQLEAAVARMRREDEVERSVVGDDVAPDREPSSPARLRLAPIGTA